MVTATCLPRPRRAAGLVLAAVVALMLPAGARAALSPFTADFAVTVGTPSPVAVTPGASTSLVVGVTRSARSSGTVTLSLTGLPTGVGAQPVSTTLAAPAGQETTTKVTMRIVASGTAAPRIGVPVTVIATPGSAAAGPDARTAALSLNVRAVTDVRVTGVEVTQGIQTPALPTRSATDPSAAVAYTGVPLQANNPTVVRVYANDAGGRKVPGVAARLHGTSASGDPLPGSPLTPDPPLTARVLVGGPNAVTDAERRAAEGAYTFTLPMSWTGPGRPTILDRSVFQAPKTDFVTALRAEVVPPATGTDREECVATACAVNNVLAVSRVRYVPTCCVRVLTAEVTAPDGVRPRPVREALAETINVTPLDMVIPDYRVTIDGTPYVVDRNGGSLEPGETPAINRNQVIADLQAMLQTTPSLGELAMAVGPQNYGGGGGQPGFAYVSDNPGRPFTANGHEFHHALGRPHVSSVCGGGGVAWAPDEIGLVQGFALDRRVGTPYRILATPAGVPTAPGTKDSRGFYDLMSYCAVDGVPNEWISVRGWTSLVTAWAYDANPLPSTLPARAQQAGTGLFVAASVSPASAEVLRVRPVGATAPANGPAAAEQLVALDGSGAVIGTGVLHEGDVDGHAGEATPGRLLVGRLDGDPAATHTVQVVRDGAVVASRTRSAHAPGGAFLSPRAGTVVGRGRTVDIRWRADDADGDPVSVTVEWSPRGGLAGTWRPVSVGPNGGRVRVPSDYFGGTARGRLRLRLSDGMNQTLVTSPVFRVVHRPPRVTVLGRRVIRTGRLVQLRAEAFDETGTPVRGRALLWQLNGRPVARGEDLVRRGLRPGTHVVRVTATDPAGRSATATMRVRVRGR